MRETLERQIIHDHVVRFFTQPEFELSDLSPSEWAEQKRYMGSEVSNFKGQYSYDLTPYLREIVDMLKPDHPMTECVIMKGSQLGMSTGIIENGIGYIIDQQPGQILLAARDEGLVKIMMDTKVDQMIDSCGLRDKIQSNSKKTSHKRTGDTSMAKEFKGGGLKAFSIQKPGRMRQISAQYGFLDDFEAAPVDPDAGSADSLFRTRFTSFGDSRKIFWISTPEVKHTSNIEPLYEEGDQRKWHVPCPCCGTMIILEWKTTGTNGKHAGIIYKLDKDGDLIEESVGYRCQECGDDFHEGHKHDMNLQGQWIATAKQADPTFFSYQINALNAPAGMADWIYYVKQFLKACPPGERPDVKRYKTFIQTVLGQTWEERGTIPKVTQLASNTRKYEIGSVPDMLTVDEGNGQIVLVTMSCDINGDQEDDVRLDYEITAWTESGSSYSIDHGSIGTFIARENTLKKKVDREKWSIIPYSKRNVWDPLMEIISKQYPSAKGEGLYNIGCFVLDSGKHTAYAYDFVDRARNESGVISFALKGVGAEEFRKFDADTAAFRASKERPDSLMLVHVNQVKDELATLMTLKWSEMDDVGQPNGFMNFPAPNADKYTMKTYFSHFEGERKVLKTDTQGKNTGYRWEKKNSNAQNHFWDCRVYNMVAKEIIMFMVCKELKINPANWRAYCRFVLYGEQPN